MNVQNTLLFKTLGFKPKDGLQSIYYKIYSQHDYEITIDLKNEKIVYPTPIRVSDQTTSNFKSQENFVVLECVNRLLEQGYKPENIELERNFQLGHRNKGKLDINVYHEGKSSTFLMIECKTFGNEYEKAKKKTLADGGQLLSYYQQDDSAEFLCLYSSQIQNGKIAFEYDVIECTSILKAGADVKAKHKAWNKQLKQNGIFEKNVLPYDFKPVALTINDLEALQEKDSGTVFNGFMEILRHNVVSDKGNAFNKIFNLFLCKLHDEQKIGNQELEFQWKETDNPEDFLMRLNDLYARGVKDYLNKEIKNLSNSQIDDLLKGSAKEEIKRQIKLF